MPIRIKSYWEECPYCFRAECYERTDHEFGYEYHCIGGNVHFIVNDDMTLKSKDFVKHINGIMKRACKMHCKHYKDRELQIEKLDEKMNDILSEVERTCDIPSGSLKDGSKKTLTETLFSI